MIYRVVLDDLYDLHTSDINCMLLNPSLELEMNSAGSFNFTLPPTHPYWDSIEILKSTIDVYEDDDLIFTGRVANIDKNWNNERVVECEGALAYFNDSIHRQMKWETPLPIAVDPDNQPEDPSEHIQNFLEDVLNNHNVFVGNATNRQIHIGHIYVDPYLVTREVDYDTTLDILTRMCIDTNGGYFMIRKDPETHLLYLDWLKDFTEESGQPASFGVNLLDFNTGLHAADICTGVLARGATVNDQVVTLSNVELVDETTYPDMSVDHYTDRYQDILWHREGMAKFGQVVQVHEFPDAQTDWKNNGQVVANSLFEEARKWLEEKNTKVESIEVEVAELSWLQEGVPKYKLGQIVEILDDAHMAGESYEVRRLPMYKLSCDLNSGSKKVTLGRPPKKELTQISASNSDSSTLSSGNSSGSSSGGGSGSGEECKVHDVRVDGTSVVSDKIANISLAGKADVSTVNAAISELQSNFQDGVDDIYDACVSKGSTPASTALADVVQGILDIPSSGVEGYKYLRSRYTNLGFTLSNWVFKLTDSFELIFKMMDTQARYGQWPGFMGIESGTASYNNSLFHTQFNFYGGRRCLNIAYNGVWAGDGNISYDTPFDYDNFYKFKLENGTFTMLKGSDYNDISTVAFTYSRPVGSDADTSTVKLLKHTLTAQAAIDIKIYGLKVWRSGVLIHNYVPGSTGLHDEIDDISYGYDVTGCSYGIEYPINDTIVT